jgi:hypothetical protein
MLAKRHFPGLTWSHNSNLWERPGNLDFQQDPHGILIQSDIDEPPSIPVLSSTAATTSHVKSGLRCHWVLNTHQVSVMLPGKEKWLIH